MSEPIEHLLCVMESAISPDDHNSKRQAVLTAIRELRQEANASQARVRVLEEALRALLVMCDRGPKPRKFDEALSWRENDERAQAMARAALGETKEQP